MAKTDKCTGCGAIRIVKNDLCKRCRNAHEDIKVVGGAAE